MKYALGKLELTGVEPEELPYFAAQMNLEILPITTAEASTFHKLPRLSHKDPFASFVRINSPRSDMCDTCDFLKSTLISIAHEHKEGEEVPLPPSKLIDHLSLAHAAREDYRADQKKAHKKEISHFSFDYSQNLTLPQKADQPGSFYFFSLRNIYIF